MSIEVPATVAERVDAVRTVKRMIRTYGIGQAEVFVFRDTEVVRGLNQARALLQEARTAYRTGNQKMAEADIHEADGILEKLCFCGEGGQ